jgi:hypothetical protein
MENICDKDTSIIEKCASALQFALIGERFMFNKSIDDIVFMR